MMFNVINGLEGNITSDWSVYSEFTFYRWGLVNSAKDSDVQEAEGNLMKTRCSQPSRSCNTNTRSTTGFSGSFDDAVSVRNIVQIVNERLRNTDVIELIYW